MAELGAFLATVSTSAATLVAAFAYWRAQGFPMVESIRLARETRRWLKAHNVDGLPAWDQLPDDLRTDMEDLANRKLRGVAK